MKRYHADSYSIVDQYPHSKRRVICMARGDSETIIIKIPYLEITQDFRYGYTFISIVKHEKIYI